MASNNIAEAIDKISGTKNPSSSIVEAIDKMEDGIGEVVAAYLDTHPIDVDGAVTSVNGKSGRVTLNATDVGAISTNDLQNAVNGALTQAKQSGEFDGAQGPKGDKGDTGATGAQGPKGDTGVTGAQGPKGDNGTDGFSPTATVTKSGKVATITITDKNGTTTATVNDGEDGTGESGVSDVQVNGASVVEDGVANIPKMSSSNLGVAKVYAPYGLAIANDGLLYISNAYGSVVKEGASTYMPITPIVQHESVFYGLAKAAGDTTQSASSNPVGTYTDAAKSAIHEMLGIEGAEDIDSIKQFVFNETSTNRETKLIPNIPYTTSSYTNPSGGYDYYLSNRVISRGSFIKNVKIYTGVTGNGDVLFVDNDDTVVYKYSTPCVANEWNTFVLNLLATEDLRLVVHARAAFSMTSTSPDAAFSPDGFWSSKQTSAEVGDTMTFTNAPTLNFMIAAQCEIETGYKFADSVVDIKDKRPASGYHNFSVSVNYHDFTDNTADGESLYTDYGVVALPTNYSSTGTPTKLIILCGGTGERIGATTNPLSFNGWSYYLAKGYAVMDMNGMSTQWGTAMGFPANIQHYCNKYLIDSYTKGYEYVIDKYNIDSSKVFIAGISMGGGASALLVQSRVLPIVAHCEFCPALSVYKQDYMAAWGGDSQRKTIAGQYGFTDWSETTTFDQEYFLQNIDKIAGFDNLTINTIGDIDVANAHYGDAEEAAAYNSMKKFYPVPIKIWHCVDDGTVLYRYSEFFVNMIRNAGGQAWLRTFPTGYHIGGWNNGSVTDTDVDGNEITTSIPFYESVLFFKRFGG